MEKIIILNNKSNLTKDEFNNYLKKLKKIKYNFILAPSMCYLPLVDNIDLATQDVSEFEEGAYTGCVAASQLKSLNVKYSLIGHSERIKYFRESNICLKNKIKHLLDNNITPVLCMSETVNIKKGISNNIMQKLNNVLKYFTKEELEKIIIAYEPYWAIGTNEIPNEECLNKIFGKINNKYPNTKVIYGGSVNKETLKILKNINLIDGYLLGTLSLKVDELNNLLEELNK